MSVPPMRIAHVITGLSVGGAELMLERLATELRIRGHEQIVFSLGEVGIVGNRLKAIGVEVVALEMSRRAFPVHCIWRLAQSLRRFGPTVVQTWLYHSDFAGLLVAPWIRSASLCWNIRCSELNSDYPTRSTRWLVTLLAWASRYPDAVVVNSQAGLDDHRRLGYRPKRWELIGNVVDAQRYCHDISLRGNVREEFGLAEETPVIGLVARYHPMKDHGNFLVAASRVVSNFPSARFLLVGTGITRSNQALVDLVQRLSLSEYVILAGERRDMQSVYCALDIAVSSSSYAEGFPNVLGEAMACMVPCVATDVGESARLMGEGGIAVSPRNPDALAGAIKRILALKVAERNLMGRKGRERVVEQFSTHRIAACYERLYDELERQ